MKEGLMDAMAAALSLPLRIVRRAVGRWGDRWNREAQGNARSELARAGDGIGDVERQLRELQARDVEVERRIAQLDEATVARRLAMLAHPAGQGRGEPRAKSA